MVTVQLGFFNEKLIMYETNKSKQKKRQNLQQQKKSHKKKTI